jgi:alpha-beta hydrolase superfamily lysophospholipase
VTGASSSATGAARPPAAAAPATPLIASSPASAYVRAENGDRLPVRIWAPVGRPRRVVVALHGMVTHSGWFAPLAGRLAAQGIATVAPDRRGNGLAIRLPEPGDVELLISDVGQVAQLARELGDDVTLLSWCGSANFAVPAAARLGAAGAIQRLVMASPGLVPLDEMAARFRAGQPVDGRLPIHFEPATDFTDDPDVQRAIRADSLYLRWIPLPLREAWRRLNPLARQALAALPVPARCVLTRTDRMIDVARTAELMADRPVHWAPGGHGFIVEPAGADAAARVLGEP